MNVGEQLRSLLEHCDKSKNTVIKETQIDRSSFYKILSGERHATQEQMAAILDAIHPDEAARRQLIDRYEYEQAGAACSHDRATVRAFLNGLSQEPPAAGTIDETLRQIVQESLSAGTAHYDICLPIGSRYMTALLALLAEYAGDDRDDSRDTMPEIRAIMANDGAGRDMETDQIFRELGRWYAYLRRETLRFHAYELPGQTAAGDAIPFPYYILSGGTLALISADETRLAVTQEPAIVDAYRENHAAQCAWGREIASTETGYEPILQFIMGLWQTVGQGEIYLLTPRPCLWLCSDDDMVRRYLQSEQLVQYGQLYRSLNLREFTTHSGMDQFLSEGRIAEAGFDIPVSPEDLAAVRARIEQNTNNRTFFLDEERVHLPQDWQLFLVAHKASVFIPYRTTNYMMCSTASAVVEPLTEWCRSRYRELNNDILR